MRQVACDTDSAGRPHFEFCRPTNAYTPVWEEAPRLRTVSVNVNAALLRHYARSMGNVGLKEDVYDRHYTAMVERALAEPGRLQSATRGKAFGAISDLGFVDSFARVSGDGTALRGVVGAVFLDVYQVQHRPLNDKNVALIYIEGPDGAGCHLRGPAAGHRYVLHEVGEFLRAVEKTAENTMLAVCEYNCLARGRGELPSIELLQYCLVSGGTTRHPEASKLDVAEATVRGLIAGSSASSRDDTPTVRLTYDDGVFEKAVKMVLSS